MTRMAAVAIRAFDPIIESGELVSQVNETLGSAYASAKAISYELKCRFDDIPEVENLRTGSIEGIPMKSQSVKDKVIIGLVAGVSAALMIAASALA